jgi:hypothetical protein
MKKESKRITHKYDKKKTCKKHGYTLFVYKKNQKGEWWPCYKCLKLQWKKATAKRMLNPKARKYNRDYSKTLNNILKSLSVYLAMILLAASIKPE